MFTTAAPYQRDVEIHVLQGERPLAKDNKTIGKFKLKGIKRAPAGVPQIEVTFDIDANGILMVSAKDLDTGKAQSITVSSNDKMSDEEIERAMHDASEYAGVDQLRRETLEMISDANLLLSKTKQAMKEKEKQLERTDKKQLKNDCNALQKQLSKVRVDKITEEQDAELRRTKEQLEASAGRILR